MRVSALVLVLLLFPTPLLFAEVAGENPILDRVAATSFPLRSRRDRSATAEASADDPALLSAKRTVRAPRNGMFHRVAMKTSAEGNDDVDGGETNLEDAHRTPPTSKRARTSRARGDDDDGANAIGPPIQPERLDEKPAFWTPPDRAARRTLGHSSRGFDGANSGGGECNDGSVRAPASAGGGETCGDEDRRIRALLREEARGYDASSESAVPKRTGYLPWDDYFLAVAYLSAMRSKDPRPSGNVTDTDAGAAPSTGMEEKRRKWQGHGACIVDKEGRIVGIGYDGFPRGCSDDCLPWASSSPPPLENGVSACAGTGTEVDDADATMANPAKEIPWLHTRDPYLCSAEVNAILNKCSADVVGARMFVPHFPCNEAAKFIIQSGIKEVLYVDDSDRASDAARASRVLFGMAGVKTTKLRPGVPSVRINFGTSKITKGGSTGSGHGWDGGRVTSIREARKLEEGARIQHRDLLLREASYDPLRPTVAKRSDYLTWDDYFMAVAFLSAQRSKDPNTQVGACIVDGATRCIIGIGYNGFPRGCSDDRLPWARTAPCELHKKYPYVVHAEVNAILNKCSADVRNATLYVALFPCNECAKVIIQAGIREVVYLNDHYHDTDACRASRILFEMSGVRTRLYEPDCEEIVIDFGGNAMDCILKGTLHKE